MGHDIFVSHANDNKAVANDLCVELEEKGLDVWIAPRDITAGQNWMEAISKAIHDSKAMVLVMGEEASESDEIQKEIRLADDYNVPTIPVAIEGIEPPHEYRYLLAGIQRLSVDPPLTEGDYNRITQAIISNTELTVDTSETEGDGQDDERTGTETDAEERTDEQDEQTDSVATADDTDTTIESDEDRQDDEEGPHSEPETDTGPRTETEEADEDEEEIDGERTIKIEDWHDLNAIRENLDANYELVNNLHRYTLGYEEHVEDPSAGWEPIGDIPLENIDQKLERDPGNFRQLFFEAVMEKLTEEELSELEIADITEIREEITEEMLKEAVVEVAIELGVDPEENQGKTSGEKYEAIEEFLQAKIKSVDMDEIEKKAYRQTSFSGTLDGNGCVIRDLVIDRPDEEGVGLFAATAGAILTEIEVEDATINGGDAVGGLAGGHAYGAEIRKAKIEGEITGDDGTGGLVGVNAEEAVVADSTADGDITGAGSTGGLVGMNMDEAVVRNSTAGGDITGADMTGGLVGMNMDEAVVADSTADGEINGSDMTGGLVGGNTDEAVVRNSTAGGDITGANSTGGLVGANMNEAVVRNSTAECDVDGEGVIGGLVGANMNEAVVRNSTAGCDVDGEDITGGLVGGNVEAAVVEDSTAESTVEGKKKVGGLVGMNEEEAVIQDSTAESTVEGDENTGRLVGLDESADNEKTAQSDAEKTKDRNRSDSTADQSSEEETAEEATDGEFVLRKDNGEETTTVSGGTARQAALKIARDLEPAESEEEATPEKIRLREKGTHKVHVYEGWAWEEEEPDDKPDWMPEEITKGNVSKEGVEHLDEI